MANMTTAAVFYHVDDKTDGSGSGSGGGGEEDGADEGYDWVQIIKYVDTALVVILSLVCVLGLLGNGVVIWAAGFRMKKTASTVWYLNLAAANFLLAASLPLAITERALDFHWPFGRFLCVTDGLVFYANMYASVFTLALIAVDRCVCSAVGSPAWVLRKHGHRITVRQASWASLGVWVLAVALSVPGFVFRDAVPAVHQDRDITVCNDNFAPGDESLNHFRFGVMVVGNFLAGLVFPLAAVASGYCVILRNARPPPQSGAGRSSSPFKVIATVSAVFFLGWAPYHVVRLVHVVSFPSFGHVLSLVLLFGLPLSHALALLTGCLNPPLYVLLVGSGGFRDVVKVLEEAFAEESPPPSVKSTPTTSEGGRQTVCNPDSAQTRD